MEKQQPENKWKVLTSEYIYKEPWLTVRQERVELPNGNQIFPYYVLEYPDWINIIAITKDKEFVIVRQYRHGLQETLYELCAGVCEKEDVSPLVSAQRELLEETGYGNGSWKEYMVVSANASTHNNLTHCFVAENVEKISEQDLEDSEDLSVHLFSFQEIKDILCNGQIKQATMLAPLWKFVAEYKP